MYSSWTTDLHEYHAHQRKIVRHFAPHLSDDALMAQERRYFAIGLTRVAVIFVVPTVLMLAVHPWFVTTPVFVLVVVICAVEIVMAIYRYVTLWPEGHRMRTVYWRQIENSEDCYHLKIKGYYHRKIAKFVAQFPSTMSSSDIRAHYHKRVLFQVALFGVAHVAMLGFLLHSRGAEPIRVWLLYLLAIGTGLVVFRFVKMQFIELPQVLTLRDHPEFAMDLVPPTEAIPFARPVTDYQATQIAQAVITTATPVASSSTRPVGEVTTAGSTEKIAL